MKNFLVIIFLLLAALKTEAQYFSNDGRFSVLEKSGCASFSVTINAPECDGSISCTAIYGDGVLQGFQTGVTPPHTYSTAGDYNLQIVFGTTGTSSLALKVFPNIQPTFEMYACTGRRVSVKIPDTNYDQYIINYDDATSVTVPKGSLAKDTHTFAVAGNRTVMVHGRNINSADNCFPAATQTINVTPTLQPAFISQLEVISASQIKLDYNDPPVSNQLSTPYQLQIVANNNIGFGIAQAGYIFNSKTTTFGNVTPDNNFYCFRMGTIDVCNSANIPISFSEVICSANFDLTIQSDVNKMNWVTSASATNPISDFSIAKNPGTPIPVAASLNSIDDVDIICNTDYCYQLITNYANTSRSISLQKCGKSFSDLIPSPIEDISSVVSETGTTLTWLQDPAFSSIEYSITKSTSGNFSFLANTATPSYTDNTYSTESLSCYKISYIDFCLNSSPISSEACPIQLSGSLSPNNDITLSWSDYTGWKNGVDHYVVEKFTSQGQFISSTDNGTSTTLLNVNLDFVNQTYIYVITAIAIDGGVSQSVSNAIRITKEPYLTYPTAFSPRGNVPDNQLFKVFGQYVTSFDLRIFNRWGQEMFYTNDFDKGWDGTYNGSLMPEGTYVFTAKITDQEGKTSDRSGTVVLLVKQ